jgi:hypothetical protein
MEELEMDGGEREYHLAELQLFRPIGQSLISPSTNYLSRPLDGSAILRIIDLQLQLFKGNLVTVGLYGTRCVCGCGPMGHRVLPMASSKYY